MIEMAGCFFLVFKGAVLGHCACTPLGDVGWCAGKIVRLGTWDDKQFSLVALEKPHCSFFEAL